MIEVVVLYKFDPRKKDLLKQVVLQYTIKKKMVKLKQEMKRWRSMSHSRLDSDDSCSESDSEVKDDDDPHHP
ncbi:hypothetical protein MRB53_004513 [Persea americana]|uniref:Uncharacterized protein n=1 Tax=Persea americana TaxID=3435 RepID=A0ACC2MAU4_PERAE|nr:hypothetical protein MRB53_004513 [Persea americana]